MKVDIWSDVRCPFCYIGKRKFEMALAKFQHKDDIEVTWHSFQLDPTLETQPDLKATDHLARIKGISSAEAGQMNRYVSEIAAEVRLHFNTNKVIVANSYNAHRLIQFAKTKGLGNEIEEQLFKAHFTEGKNIDDLETLIQIGVSVGLQEKEVEDVIASNKFYEEVRQDERDAQTIGIRGVPFFIFNHKYAISGAQSPEIFLQTMERSWSEFEKEKELTIVEGASCSIDGKCD